LNILFLGGTRFTGLNLAKILALKGHEVVVASRRSPGSNGGLESLQGERSELLQLLKNRKFDVVLDFMAYTEADVISAFESIETKRYVLISTTWLPRFAVVHLPNMPVLRSNFEFLKGLPTVTKTYLKGKAMAESAVHNIRSTKSHATIVRLPVMTGPGDATRRLDFYRTRILDRGGLIMVNSASHKIQFALSMDLACALGEWIENHEMMVADIWEGLPPDSITWKEVLLSLADLDKVELRLFFVPLNVLEERLREYLDSDPFWREKEMELSHTNLFNITGVNTTSHRIWMKELEPTDRLLHDNELRRKERELIWEMYNFRAPTH
jgi:nucleoside-diphosphate-sugar epimerase